MNNIVLDPSIFRDYDIRAVVPDQLNAEGVKVITAAITEVLQPKSVQLGHDMRVSSPELYQSMKNTFLSLGVNVVELGLISTDMLYFAAGKYEEDLAIVISASHNPANYNGIKIVKQGAVGVGKDSGLAAIKEAALRFKEINVIENKGHANQREIMSEYVQHVFSFIDVSSLRDFKVVIDAGNGMAGHFMPQIEKKIPWEVEHLYYELDGNFPNHQPSPLEEKNMQDTVNKVRETNADFGMAFDGDGDRVFMVDETGRIVSATLMTGIIAKALLEKYPDEIILYNAIIGRIVPEIVAANGGTPVRVKVGHTNIKEKMRDLNAIFCGEHAGHYYFRENYFADSAIIAALLVAEQMSKHGKKLSELIADFDKYYQSGEINFIADDKDAVISKVEARIRDSAKEIDYLDGLSVWFDEWWFNVRASNTEPLLRLNIEANSLNLLKEKKDYLIQLLKGFGAEIKL